MHYDSSMIKVLLSYLTLVVAFCESHLAVASKTKLADENLRGHGCRIQNDVHIIICSGIKSEEEIRLPNRNMYVKSKYINPDPKIYIH